MMMVVMEFLNKRIVQGTHNNKIIYILPTYAKRVCESQGKGHYYIEKV